MRSFPILMLSDGTAEGTINLLDTSEGVLLRKWVPQTPADKEGGLWRGSALTDGRQLVDFRLENTLETFDLSLRRCTQDKAIELTQDLRRLMRKAKEYWTTDWASEPVWLIARGTNETNTRYAIVKHGRIPEDTNPYAQPFIQITGRAVADSLLLIIERGPWGDAAPGSVKAASIYSQQHYVYNSNGGKPIGLLLALTQASTKPYGQAKTSNDYVTVANKHIRSNFTHIYRYDLSATTFSGNLVATQKPFIILPTPIGVGDILYLGTDSSFANSGPFSSAVFNLSIPFAATSYTIVWEYWSGAAWATLTVADASNPIISGDGLSFALTGVVSVHWEQPSNWVTNLVNGTTGYWVRARITAGTGPISVPTQAVSDIFSAILPYVQLDALDVGGDYPALVDIKMLAPSGGNNSIPNLQPLRIMVSLRSLERGLRFSPYFNVADEQQEPEVFMVVVLGALEDSTLSPTGRRLKWAPSSGSPTFSDIVSFSIDYPLAGHYNGLFRVFARFGVNAGTVTGDFRLRLTYALGPGSTTSDNVGTAVTPVIPATIPRHMIADLGSMSIPGLRAAASEELSVVNFRIQGLPADGAVGQELYLYDVILMPVDEWSAQFSAPDTNNPARDFVSVHARSASYPKRNLTATLYDNNENQRLSVWKVVSPGPAIVQANAAQRLWFLSSRFDYSAAPELSLSVRVEKLQRYESARGKR